MSELTMVSYLPPEDWAWLEGEAARRKLRIIDIINELVPEVVFEGHVSEGEVAARMEQALLRAVRQARLGVQ